MGWGGGSRGKGVRIKWEGEWWLRESGNKGRRESAKVSDPTFLLFFQGQTCQGNGTMPILT